MPDAFWITTTTMGSIVVLACLFGAGATWALMRLRKPRGRCRRPCRYEGGGQ
jgi:hypothetical protein